MKAKKLTALLVCLLTAFVLFAVSVSAEEIGPCEHGESYWVWKTKEQTCTADGESRRVCTYEGCNRTVELRIIPAHNYKTVFTNENATCISEGSVTNFCSWCNTFATVTLPVDENNHRYGEWVTKTEATCVAEGEKERRCQREGCPNPIDIASIPLDNTKHTADDKGWTTVTPSTCYAEGMEKADCKVCHKEFTRNIPIHFDYAVNTTDYNLVKKVEAKCNVVGYSQYQCLKCYELITVNRGIDPNNHDFSDKSLWEYPEGVNCQSTDAKIIKHCKNFNSHICEESYTPDHDFSGEETVIEPYCEKKDGETVLQDGQRITKCLYCDETETEVIPGSHSFGDWIDIYGTCEYGGVASRICTCGEKSEVNVTFEAGTHLNYDVLRERASTCEYKGWTEIHCSVCEKTFKLYHSALGHRPGEWQITEAATCQKSGLREIICQICNQSLDSEILPQKPHANIVIKNGVEPTCKEPGLTNYLYCNMCLTGFEQEVIPALGHNYVIQNTPEEGAVRICDRCYEYEIIDDEGNEVSCNCLCHNSNGLAKTVWRIVIFFCKLFGFNQICACGITHF